MWIGQFQNVGSDVLAGLLTLGAILATLAIYVTIGRTVSRYWRRTLGRRRELGRIVTTLSPLMQVDHFVEQLGTPAVRAADKETEDLIWIHPDAFIRARAVRGSVDVYAVTTRNRWFRPTMFRGIVISESGETIEVRLGHTTFGDLPDHPRTIYGDVGARRWGYSEAVSYGNPGGYMTYIYSLNDAGWMSGANAGMIDALVDTQTVRVEQKPGGSGIDTQLDPGVARQRQRAVFNTIAITAPHWHGDPERLGTTPGADNDVVRLVNLVGGRRGVRPVAARWRKSPLRRGRGRS